MSPVFEAVVLAWGQAQVEGPDNQAEPLAQKMLL